MSDNTAVTPGAETENYQFRLLGRGGPVSAGGHARALPPGDIATLQDRVADFFRKDARYDDRLPAVLVGALPFDRAAHDFLYQPQSFERTASTALPSLSGTARGIIGKIVRPEPSPEAYADAVRKSLAMMAEPDADPLTKVVLSRSLRIDNAERYDLAAILAKLAGDPAVTAFATPLASATGPRWLIGATPELLVSRKGRTVTSHPLAGSARRHRDAGLDRQSREQLYGSSKDRREHMIVVEAIMDTLTPFCDGLATPEGTTVAATASMWHLGTRITGTLKDADMPVAALLAELHPTPAVCGLPRRKAAEAIAALEGYQRGFYAGAVGWMDKTGDGEWYVSLRCAEMSPESIRLFAGAGVIIGSDPQAETDETSAKFQAMLVALGINEIDLNTRENAA